MKKQELSISEGLRTELYADTILSEAIAQCISLISRIEPNIGEISIHLMPGGVWNNILLKASTSQKSYYFKKYREFTKIPNYNPPSIPAKQRALVAQRVQTMASSSFVNKYKVVPSVLVSDETSFIMEAVPDSTQLFESISSGTISESTLSVLPTALAQFHSTKIYDNETLTALSDIRFRDYKLLLQYYETAHALGGIAGQILESFANEYKQKQNCVVHGDLNSRNILIGQDNTVHVIDFEQAHLGSPAFDLAYVLSELHIASIQFKESESLRKACSSFVNHYIGSIHGYDHNKLLQEVTMHLAAQIIYRFTGPSHKMWTSYVGRAEKEEILNWAFALIIPNPHSVLEILEKVDL